MTMPEPRLDDHAKELKTSIVFLTRLPFGRATPITGADIAQAVWAFPIAGILIGGMSRLIMSALSVAGQLIATQTGLAFVQTIDPTFGEQGAIVGTFFSMLGVVLIFATNLHHLAIGAIVGSFTILHPGASLPTGDMAQEAINLTSGAFALGLQLAAPFVVFGFAVNAAIGLLARLMPQLQVFFIAMPVNMLAGFFLLMLLIGSLMTVFLNYYATEMGRFLS